MSLNHIKASWRLNSLGYSVKLQEQNGKPFWNVHSESGDFIACYQKPEFIMRMCNRLSTKEQLENRRKDYEREPWRVGLHVIPV